MAKITSNKPLIGFKDLFGGELAKREFTEASLHNVAQLFGYQKLDVPLVERADAFDETIVGKSPWPEWDKRGCFYSRINDYESSFDDSPAHHDVLLIPEGTVPVSRWLGSLIDGSEEDQLPLKVFYNLTCFRNEPISSLSTQKSRCFRQFGLEIFGSANSMADAEVIFLVVHMLGSLDIPKELVRVRVNDIRIFHRLCELSSLKFDEQIKLKEELDCIAECKAGKKTERIDVAKDNVERILELNGVEGVLKKTWNAVIHEKPGICSANLRTLFSEVGILTVEMDERIKAFSEQKLNVVFDPCVVRSHEYYTGPSFEVDVNTPHGDFIEIAGGGRFDRLVKCFSSSTSIKAIPSTGFAFGVERVVEMLEACNLFGKKKTITLNFDIDHDDTRVLRVPTSNAGAKTQAYLSAVGSALSSGTSFDILTSERIDKASAQAYASKRHLKNYDLPKEIK